MNKFILLVLLFFHSYSHPAILHTTNDAELTRKSWPNCINLAFEEITDEYKEICQNTAFILPGPDMCDDSPDRFWSRFSDRTLFPKSKELSWDVWRNCVKVVNELYADTAAQISKSCDTLSHRIPGYEKYSCYIINDSMKLMGINILSRTNAVIVVSSLILLFTTLLILLWWYRRPIWRKVCATFRLGAP